MSKLVKRERYTIYTGKPNTVQINTNEIICTLRIQTTPGRAIYENKRRVLMPVV